MTRKQRIGLIFGGRSGEHEVSLMSARSVISALDPAKYEIIQIGITHAGEWLVGEDVLGALERGQLHGLRPAALLPVPGKPGLYAQDESGAYVFYAALDLVFPMLHGTFGEDGTLQGLLELAELPYVGAGVVGSAVGMDKGVFRDVMAANGIPVVETLVVLRGEIEQDLPGVIERAEQKLAGYPLFVKPANLGSSVGVSKCLSRADLLEGLMEAARFDRRILIQRGIEAREIEVSVLGNAAPEASLPGEILPSREFYSYEAKYIDGQSGLLIPAPLPEATTQRVRQLAVRAFQAVDCAGMARADFFVDRVSGEVFLNEINTIPGFTAISMYPKLWEASGLPYPALLDRLIALAFERHAERLHTEHRYQR
ncbi:MAG: D-alanine--D-alanine ligase [Anaerolineales bacterium]|jgi:D-alanine-D-alanine ligase|nr:D-alanine--D-alanine ligase [Anaerolineales bacterium]